MLNIRYKLNELIYPPNTPIPNKVNDTFLGGVRLRDVPESIDEFYRLLFARFHRRWWWLKFFSMVGAFIFKKQRFVSLSEFQEVFTKRSSNFLELQNKYPIYRLANIQSHTQQDDFIRLYETQNLEGYFFLMGKKNKKMWDIFHDWHEAYIPKKEKGRHTYIIGKSGCGKTELMKNLIIQDTIKNDSCVIVIEPGGDLAKEIAKQKNLDPNRLIYVDCNFNPCTPSINPFELIEDKENHLSVEVQAQIIRDALVQMCEAEGQPLTAQMQSILQPCLDVIITKGDATLYDLQRFADDGLNSDLIELGRKHQKHGHFFEQRFSGANLRESKNGIYQKLQNILNLSSIADFFCGTTTIDLVKAIEEKKVIVFNLSKGDLGIYGTLYLGKMVVAILQNIIFQRAKVEKQDRTPINLYIDEFQDFINKSMNEIFVQGRKYGVNLTVATQTVGQGMDTQMTNSVLSNTNIKFAGQNDYKNTRTMSNETGTELEVLQNLQVGEFLTRVGSGKSFVLSSNKEYLDDKNCVDKDNWNRIIESQIEKYYQLREKTKRPLATPIENKVGIKQKEIKGSKTAQEVYKVPFKKS